MCRPGIAEIQEIQDPELKESQNLKPADLWPSRVLELVVFNVSMSQQCLLPKLSTVLGLGKRTTQARSFC